MICRYIVSISRWTKFCTLLVMLLLLCSCGQRVTWESTLARGSFYYQSSGDQTRLNMALKDALNKINMLDLPSRGKLSLVQVIDNDTNCRVVDAVYAKIKPERRSLVKTKESDLNKNKFDYLLFVYPVVYGVKQEGTVSTGAPSSASSGGTGDRIAEVSIYSRLVDVKKNQIRWEKIYEGVDNSIYAVYRSPVFDADRKKLDALILQSQQAQ